MTIANDLAGWGLLRSASSPRAATAIKRRTRDKVAVSPISIQARAAAGPRRGLFVLGLVMALIAFIAVFAIGIALAGRASVSTKQVAIVVAARDIQAREQIAPGDVRLALYPQPQLPAGALTSVDAVKNQAAQVAILKGQPVTSNLISASAEPVDPSISGYLPIPQGFVAVTIPTGEQQGVAGYIAVGDYINVEATASAAQFGGPAREITKTVFTSLHVIRVGPAPLAAGAKAPQQQGVSSSLTVVVTQCDAQYLNWLLANTSLKYVLLSYKDYSPAPAAADPACPSTTSPAGVGPAQVEARYGFTKV